VARTEKEAVRVGGGFNHQFDFLMGCHKDNHIQAVETLPGP
jgi:nicotinate-nucleotide pyrophosphorylase